MTKELICILCPLGCKARFEVNGQDISKILGIRCKKGAEYVKQEIFHPARVLTTTLKTRRSGASLLPVRSDKPIPKDRLIACMKEIAHNTVDGPVELGQIMIKGILDLDANIIACRSLP